jgi:NDP-sugar pyrophosphorylase family protein
MRENMTIQNLYDLRNTMARPLLENLTYPWEALPLIGAFIVELGKTLSPDDYELRGENIWVAKSAKLYPNIYIAGPAIIGPNTEVRPGAFIRGNALIGAGCVVGNSTEIKNAILFDGAQAPHYNYIGDSILGYKAHTAPARSPRTSSRTTRRSRSSRAASASKPRCASLAPCSATAWRSAAAAC